MTGPQPRESVLAGDDHPRSQHATRSQSNVIGVILLTVVIVILVGGFGVVYIGASDQGTNDGPLVDATVNLTADRVTVTHTGGESVAIADLDVLLRGDAASERYTMDQGNVTDASGQAETDGRFDPGDRYSRAHGLESGEVTIFLIHTESNAVLDNARFG